MKNVKRYALPVLTATLLSLSLSSCVGALIGGAAVGTKSAIDRRITGAQTDDNIMASRVETTARSYLRQNNQVQGYTPKLNVVGYSHHLLLPGQVATEGEKQFVERIACSEQAVEGVYSYITVASQARSLSNVINDTWGTSEVRVTLLGFNSATQARAKIVTYGNVTYVMGILIPDEQTRMAQKVSTTVSVQKVVTLYQSYVAN